MVFLVSRILRKVAANKTDDLGDLSTLGEPEILTKIIEKHNSAKS
jgi:acetyl-CoA synthetase